MPRVPGGHFWAGEVCKRPLVLASVSKPGMTSVTGARADTHWLPAEIIMDILISLIGILRARSTSGNRSSRSMLKFDSARKSADVAQGHMASSSAWKNLLINSAATRLLTSQEETWRQSALGSIELQPEVWTLTKNIPAQGSDSVRLPNEDFSPKGSLPQP